MTRPDSHFKVLVVGCGNIGALFDIDSDKVFTHSKAFHTNEKFEFAVFDNNPSASEVVASKYQVPVMDHVSEKTLQQFDVLSICTPTDNHSQLVQMAINSGVKTILCEKPLTPYENEIKLLRDAYLGGNSKVLVNYVRRFQPKYEEIKGHLSRICQTEQITNISIRYQRGFLNNCSHAVDTIEFLCDLQIDFTKAQIISQSPDSFDYDPTITLFIPGPPNINIAGLEQVKYSHFEFDLFFEKSRLSLRDGGQQIVLDDMISGTKLVFEDCLENYMVPVVGKVYRSLIDEGFKDNFISSLELNQRMLETINMTNA